jgi:hypothetical protein
MTLWVPRLKSGYLYNVLLIGGDLCDFAFLCEGVEGESEVIFHVFVEIIVVA